jgi:hypothetical protein
LIKDLTSARNEIEELRGQVDASASYETIIETLSEKNMEMVSKVSLIMIAAV